jgi:hypothetical protein
MRTFALTDLMLFDIATLYETFTYASTWAAARFCSLLPTDDGDKHGRPRVILAVHFSCSKFDADMVSGGLEPDASPSEAILVV